MCHYKNEVFKTNSFRLSKTIRVEPDTNLHSETFNLLAHDFQSISWDSFAVIWATSSIIFNEGHYIWLQKSCFYLFILTTVIGIVISCVKYVIDQQHNQESLRRNQIQIYTLQNLSTQTYFVHWDRMICYKQQKTLHPHILLWTIDKKSFKEWNMGKHLPLF